jgi:hypothetical protein
MLEEIAANDYGEEVPVHLAGIGPQLALEAPLGKLDWCPREVLELQAWGEPDDLPDAGREHVKRMLACTILLRNAGCAVPESPFNDFFLEVSASTLLQLARSIMVDRQAELTLTAGLALLLWLYESQPFAPLQPFAAFGALMLASCCDFGSATESNVQAVCHWVDAVEARCRSMVGGNVQSERWLLGLNPYVDFNDRPTRWLSVATTAFSRVTRASGETKSFLHSMLQRLST